MMGCELEQRTTMVLLEYFEKNFKGKVVCTLEDGSRFLAQLLTYWDTDTEAMGLDGTFEEFYCVALSVLKIYENHSADLQLGEYGWQCWFRDFPVRISTPEGMLIYER